VVVYGTLAQAETGDWHAHTIGCENHVGRRARSDGNIASFGNMAERLRQAGEALHRSRHM